MISGLIDELNKSADEWNASNMFELARMCRDAADTIWELRDDLQRANDAVRDAEHDESRAWDRVRKAEAENAKLREQIDAAHMSRLLTENENEKLRELCGFMLRCMKRNHDCDCCLVNGEHCEISYIESDARELGVEVSE